MGRRGRSKGNIVEEKIPLVRVDDDQAGQVPSLGFENIQIFAPTGKVYKLLGMHLRAVSPPGATAGWHGFEVTYNTIVQALKGEAVFGTITEFTNSQWVTPTTSGLPDTSEAQGKAMRRMRCDDTQAIVIRYENMTDANQTQLRKYQFYFEKVSE